MSTFCTRASVAALAIAITTSFAAAQTPTAPQSSNSMDKPAQSTADQVKTWTQKQWSAAKTEWRKDRAKWDSCNQQSTAKHLSGRASWSFIYDCMKA